MTSVTRLDKCLFAETQNMHVVPKGLRNTKYKSTNFVSFLQHRWNKVSKHIHYNYPQTKRQESIWAKRQ